MHVLGIIPARGGSKGVPGKNIRPLAGKSLIQRTYENAMKSRLLREVILSTDSEQIAEHARQAGVPVPFLRPPELASDTSAMIDVVLHAIEAYSQRRDQPEAVMLLQPTSPLRSPDHIDRAIELLEEHDSVCSVVPLPLEMCPHYVMKLTGEGYLDYFLPEGRNIKRRQDVVPAYKREGTVYLTKTRVLYESRNFYGTRCKPMIIPAEESLSIDTEADWQKAEQLLRNN